MKKVLLTTVMSLLMCMGVYAQDCGTCSPKEYEIVLGSHSASFSSPTYNWSDGNHYYSGYSNQELYNILLNKAKQIYPNRSNLKIRNMKLEKTENTKTEKKERKESFLHTYVSTIEYHTFLYYGTFTVVVEDPQAKQQIVAKEAQGRVLRKSLSKLDESTSKALINIPIGARMAIDKIIAPDPTSNDAINDQLLDLLLDKGYRVVAKEYLQKLYKEQQDQLSGFYNDSTIVQGNNFSAVGYFINVKVTESSIRVQVVNISTGEYEGNATVNF